MWREALASIRAADVVDLAVVAALLWVGIVWLQTARARMALVGVVLLGAVYLLASEMGLTLTAWILQGFVAASVILIVVVFQEDIRRLFEQIAVLALGGRPLEAAADPVEPVVRSLARLAHEKRGALVVVPGREPLERHLQGGVQIDARISEPLLLSLFDPHSPGHDGAVVLGGDRITHFAVHLPLSTDHAQLGQRGTRHAAALGLAERTDALCLVVSEERGQVSVARQGKLKTLARPELAAQEIRRFVSRLAPQEEGGRWRRLARRWREAAIALGVAVPLWVLTVPGGDTIAIQAPVVLQDLPQGYSLVSIEPPELEVTLAGPRRHLLLFSEEKVEVRVNAVLAELGRRTFSVSPAQVSHPPGIEVVSVAPDTIRISLEEAGTGRS